MEQRNQCCRMFEHEISLSMNNFNAETKFIKCKLSALNNLHFTQRWSN